MVAFSSHNQLNPQGGPDPATSSVAFTRVLRDGAREQGLNQPLPAEYGLSVYCEGACVMCITCTPLDLDALIVGRLYSESIISGVDDIQSITVDEEAGRMDICLAPGVSMERNQPVFVPTYGLSGQPSEADGQAGEDALPMVVPIEWSTEEVFTLANDFARDTPIHRITYGSHSCHLVGPDGQRFCCEDLGRHNALDKVIGRALLSGIDLTRSLVFSSGRIPVDMVSKVIRSHIPLLVTKAVPTDLSVRLAQQCDLTLICSARPDSIKVFNDPIHR